MTLGNEDNMQKVREARKEAEALQKTQEISDQVHAGGDHVHHVDIDFTTERDENFKGRIVFKHMTLMDLAKAGARKAELFVEAGVKSPEQRDLLDGTVQFMIHMVANLEGAITKAPAWLTSLKDNNNVDLIAHIYGKYEDWQDSFRKPSPSEPKEDNTTSESTEAVDA